MKIIWRTTSSTADTLETAKSAHNIHDCQTIAMKFSIHQHSVITNLYTENQKHILYGTHNNQVLLKEKTVEHSSRSCKMCLSCTYICHLHIILYAAQSHHTRSRLVSISRGIPYYKIKKKLHEKVPQKHAARGK